MLPNLDVDNGTLCSLAALLLYSCFVLLAIRTLYVLPQLQVSAKSRHPSDLAKMKDRCV